jgi:hypothetical protein
MKALHVAALVVSLTLTIGLAAGASEGRFELPQGLGESAPGQYSYFYLPFVPKYFYSDGQTWDSSINIVNTGTSLISVRMFFLNSAGGQYVPTALAYPEGTLSNPFALGAGGSVEILPFNTDELPGGSVYSVVMTSTGDIAAIANLTTWINSPAPPHYNGSYSGAASGATKVFMPSVVWHYYDWNSHLAVQNLTGSAQNISVVFYYEGTSGACNGVGANAVPPYATFYVDVSTLDLASCDTNADGYNGSATITSGGDIFAVDNQTAATTVWGPAGRTQTYSGFGAGSTDLYAPALYYGYYGWDSSINVQNVGTGVATVYVLYSDGYSLTTTIPTDGSVLLYQYTEGQAGNHTAGTKFSGFMRATSGGPLVAVVNAATNQPWPGGYAPYDQAQTYSALTPDEATGTLVFPQIMREYYGWYTSYTVQNATNSDVNLLISYDGMGSLCQDIAYGPLGPNANVEFYQGGPTDALCPNLPGAAQPGDPNIASYRGAVTVEVDGVGWIVGVANQTNFAHRVTSGETGDWSMSYNGINR